MPTITGKPSTLVTPHEDPEFDGLRERIKILEDELADKDSAAVRGWKRVKDRFAWTPFIANAVIGAGTVMLAQKLSTSVLGQAAWGVGLGALGYGTCQALPGIAALAYGVGGKDGGFFPLMNFGMGFSKGLIRGPMIVGAAAALALVPAVGALPAAAIGAGASVGIYAVLTASGRIGDSVY